MFALLLISHPSGKYEEFTYYPDGKKHTETVFDSGSAAAITSEYDQNGRLSSRTYPDGGSISYTYDSFGRIYKVFDYRTNGVGKNHNQPRNESDPDDRLCYQYGYDAQGRTISIDCYDDQEEHTILYDYYGDGQRKSIEVKDINDARRYYVEYAYDSIGRISTVYEQHAGSAPVQVAAYTYDTVARDGTAENCRRKTITYGSMAGGSGERVYTMDPLGRVTSIDNKFAGTSFCSFSYTIDGLGRRRVADETLPALGEGQLSGYQIGYDYDNLSRLLRADFGTASDLTRSYNYDNIGNRIDTSGWTYLAPDVTLRMPDAVGNPEEPVNSDILSSDGAYSYTFDENGNLKERTGSADKTVYTYDLDNRLWKVEISQNQLGQWVLMQTVTYTYDPLGNLIRRVSSGSTENKTTTYTVDLVRGLPVVLIESENGTDVARYTYGDDLLKVSRSGEYYYFYDGLGSTRVIADENGSVVARYAYDPYGAKLDDQSSGPDWNNFLFTGEFCDPATNLIYLRARWYDPGTGRLASRDTLAGLDVWPLSQHRYLYCADDPVNRIDPSGQSSLTETVNVTAIQSFLFANWFTCLNVADFVGGVVLGDALPPGFSIIPGGAMGQFSREVGEKAAKEGVEWAGRWLIRFRPSQYAEAFKNYFPTFSKVMNGIEYRIHHVLPQWTRKYFGEGFVDNIGNLAAIPEELHRRIISPAWKKFQTQPEIKELIKRAEAGSNAAKEELRYEILKFKKMLDSWIELEKWNP